MMQTLHIEKVLKNNPDIRLFRFIKFSFENKVQDRLSNISSDEMSVIERCINIREKMISLFGSLTLDLVRTSIADYSNMLHFTMKIMSIFTYQKMML